MRQSEAEEVRQLEKESERGEERGKEKGAWETNRDVVLIELIMGLPVTYLKESLQCQMCSL